MKKHNYSAGPFTARSFEKSAQTILILMIQVYPEISHK
jgi:hypothetical protein